MSKVASTPIEKLFGSKTRAKLLQLFYENPEKSFYVREMTRVIDEQINSVRRELLNLESIGIIKTEAPVYASKVQLVCPKCGKPTRVGHVVEDGKKLRVCKKCGKSFE